MKQPVSHDPPELILLRKRVADLEAQLDNQRADSENLKWLCEQAPLCYHSLDANGALLEVNKAWSDVTGFREDEVIGRNFTDFLAPDHRDRFREEFSHFKALGMARGVEFTIVSKDGSFLQVTFHCRLTRNPQGAMLHFHCIFQDITKNRRTETALRRQEQDLLAILNASTETTLLIDPSGKILVANEAMTRCMHKPIDEIVGRRVDELFSPDVALKRMGSLQQVVETGKPVSFLDKRDHLIFETHLNPVLDETGRVSRVAVFAMDITERKRTEQQLIESKTRHRAQSNLMRLMCDSVPDMVWAKNLEKKYIFANKTLCRYLLNAVDTNEPIGKTTVV